MEYEFGFDDEGNPMYDLVITEKGNALDAEED